MGTRGRQATEGVRRCPTAQCCPEDHRFNAVIVKRAPRRKPTLGSVREVAHPRGAATNRVCSRVEVPTAIAARRSRLPARGSWTCFPEQKSDRARRECPTGDSTRTQKAHCTNACCWAMETSTTGVKVMKGLTRPCADPAINKRRRGHRQARQSLC